MVYTKSINVLNAVQQLGTCCPQACEQESRVATDQLLSILVEEFLLGYSHTSSILSSTNGLFGLELTFTNDKLIELARNEREMDYKLYSTDLLEKWIEQIRHQWPCVQIGQLDKDSYGYSKVTLAYLSCNIEFYLHSDDWVFEIGATPMTSAIVEKNLLLIQQTIFDTASAIGLKPHRRIGGGHFHLDKETHFGKDNSVLFRNFLVDLMNRPELFLGGLSLDLLNAPPLAILSKEQQEAFG
ncbi:unnamed protein product [Didymodactylos carnosus]|uniref:Uncharacterized protein n=1 Tax=Didymodactylos carnosus TaxID=1234261 RepID=A0A8S2F8H5_9BILA|nr:unnamed protein product [Didymodactylos carnosus]CAF4175544.1 unnamed protein product [Didymodactylos carnosus]